MTSAARPPLPSRKASSADYMHNQVARRASARSACSWPGKQGQRRRRWPRSAARSRCTSPPAIPSRSTSRASRPISWRARRRSCRKNKGKPEKVLEKIVESGSRPTPRKTACWSRSSSSTVEDGRAGPEGSRGRPRCPGQDRRLRALCAGRRHREEGGRLRGGSRGGRRRASFGLRID